MLRFKHNVHIFQITVGATPLLLIPMNPNRKALLVYNNSGGTVEILSNSGGTYGSGIPILTGNTYVNDYSPEGEYWIVGSGAGLDVRVEEDTQLA